MAQTIEKLIRDQLLTKAVVVEEDDSKEEPDFLDA